MSWILDGVAVALAVLFLVLGAKRGFIKSAIRLIGMVVALVAAALISNPLSETIFEAWIREPVTVSVAAKAADAAVAAATTVQDQIVTVLEAMPSMVQSAFDLSGMAMPQTGAPVEAESLTTLIVDAILRPLCVSTIQAILFLLIFVGVLITAILLAKAADKVFNTLPLIRQVNGLLGGAVGLLEGIGVIYVLSLVLRLYMTMSGVGSVITAAHLDATYIVKYFVNFRLLS